MKRLGLLFGLIYLACSCAATPVLAQQSSEGRRNVSPLLFPAGAESDMKTLISLSAVDQPLSVIVQNLSASSGVALKVVPSLGVQRMTICVKDKPFYEVAGRIVETLSHQVGGSNHYFWEAIFEDGKKVYTLRFASSAAQEYRKSLAQPYKEATQTLIDFRTIASLMPEERSRYKGSFSPLFYSHVDKNPYVQAVKSLTEPQFTTLIRTGRATLSASKIESSLSSYYEMAKTDMFTANDIVKVPNGPYRPPVSQIRLQMFSMSDYSHRTDYSVDIDDPVLSEIYEFQLGGISTSGILLNLFQEENNRVGRLPETGEAKQIFDLGQILSNKSATFAQRNDIGYVLSVLSQATGKSIYEEHFLRPGYRGFGQLGSGLPDISIPKVLKGTLPQIINSICSKWDYQVTQAPNGDLVFWSRRWGRDEQADISDKTLEPWRRRFEQNGHFTEADYRDMVQKLSWAQTRITLPYAFKFTDAETIYLFLQSWSRRRYLIRRIDSSLTPAEREAALSPEGLRIANMAARQFILSELHFQSEAQIAALRAGNSSFAPPTKEQILESRIFLSKPKLEGLTHPELVTERLDGLPYDPLTLTIKSEIGLRWE